MSDWDASGDETAAKPAAVIVKPPPKKANKWEGEDDENDGPVSDWENSESEEEKRPAVVSNAAPPKKKGSLKAKLAEKEALRASKAEDDDSYDEDAVLDPRAKALRDKQRELESDMKNAAELFGTDSSDIRSILTANPKTKEDFIVLSRQIFELAIKRHQDKPLYAAFVEAHAKVLADPLRDVEIKKVASGLTALANEKQKEAKDKGKSKKKPPKPALGSTKALGKATDTNLYEEALDDFGDDPNDFM
ncbi:translation initiation factor eIF3 subunit [Thelephora terrestris]|uniref:Eukaryotic translation initiation factor 3 subunit J n=1 Tax=Thelephora terrestris TaxID=56493 RepID=A0A9P6H6A2_9AGAM|nr:translation initiation factor eIF3 subunit [Thelephora terrestris]